MSSQGDKRLIVGLGNPGSCYEKTRHNYGFMVVEAFARQQGWLFKRPFRIKGQVAMGLLHGYKIYVLMPHTYMNLSGEAVAKLLRLYHITADQLIVVVDDVALPFGTMRLRSKGSSGGHNGLVSVEQALQTQNYLRLRMGIGNQQVAMQPLETFVLSRFSREEELELPKYVDVGINLLENWLKYGTESVLRQTGSIK